MKSINYKLIIFIYFPIIILFASCSFFNKRPLYPHLQKVAVQSFRQFDSIVEMNFPQVQVIDIKKDSAKETQHYSQEEKNYEHIINRVNNSKMVKQVITKYHIAKTNPKLKSFAIAAPRISVFKNHSLAQNAVNIFLKVLIIIVLNALFILLIIFLAKLLKDGTGCLGAFILLALILFELLFLLGSLRAIISP